MTEIEKIKRYIKRTNVKYPDGTPYQMSTREAFALRYIETENTLEAVCLAFNYGRAKGERHARAAQRQRP